jgi:predicted GNAT family N-acyltransferase
MLILHTTPEIQRCSAQARPSLRDCVSASGARSCELALWSPWQLASSAGALRELRSFRRTVYAEFGVIGADGGAGADPMEAADPQAWHLLATRRETGELVGCIRFIVFERARLPEIVDSVLQNSGCRFSPEDHARCRMALSEYWAAWLRRSGPFLQIGGLAVAASARGSALAPTLGLAANAFMRTRESRFGVVFEAERTAGGPLYEDAGFAPMALGPGLLPPLTDLFHGDRALVMKCEPYGVRADLAREVEQLCAYFQEVRALGRP